MPTPLPVESTAPSKMAFLNKPPLATGASQTLMVFSDAKLNVLRTQPISNTMKSTKTLAVVLFSSVLAVRAFAADTYNLDPNHSTVGFSVSHLVINNVHGKFKEFSGTVVVDDKTIKEAKGTIEVKSIDTGITKRDDHLRTPDFFDAQKYPTITFVSKRAEKQGDENVLIGDFSMHGVTKEISLPVKLSGPITDPWGGTRIGLHAKTKVSRKEFGVSYNATSKTGSAVVGDEIEIEISAEAVKAKS
jgi:polyisoprenoid-binding protein YceI